MNGHKFLKVTGILMIIAAVFSIIAGVFVGGLGALGGRTRRSIWSDICLLGSAVSDTDRRDLPADRRNQRRQAQQAQRKKQAGSSYGAQSWLYSAS